MKPKFKVGEAVSFPLGISRASGVITEDRGNLGVGGRRIYGVLFSSDPVVPASYVELPEEELQRVPPTPLAEYVLKAGTKIKIRYTGGLASDPVTCEEEFIVGNITETGGTCDCCSILKYPGVVLSEVRLVESQD
jgi:hypothetical protein